MTTNKYYEMLDNAPEHLEDIAHLFSWSENYDYPTPATLYLDLTNYSEEFIGVNLCAEKMPTLGYLEIDLLANALREYAARPIDATEFVAQLLAAEYEDEEEEESADNV
jgi:hypothetical protein